MMRPASVILFVCALLFGAWALGVAVGFSYARATAPAAAAARYPCAMPCPIPQDAAMNNLLTRQSANSGTRGRP